MNIHLYFFRLGKKLENPNIDLDQVSLLTRQIKDEQKQLDDTRKELESIKKPIQDKNKKQQIFEELFVNADIIATTLNSSMNGHMETFFVKKYRGILTSVCEIKLYLKVSLECVYKLDIMLSSQYIAIGHRIGV